MWPGLILAGAIAASAVVASVVPSSRLPASQLEVADGWTDESSCHQCHEQARSFGETGHAQTLHRADDATLAALIDSLNSFERFRDAGSRITRTSGDVRASNQRDGFRADVPLSWCFGSGRHARTWVASLPDSFGMTDILEFRWSWYREIGGFDITPVQPIEPGGGYYAHLGVLFDHAKGRRCFSCHATSLPEQAGAIDEGHLRAGVTCQRCHGPRAAHVQSGGQAGDRFWASARRDESVARCAECHRSPDEQEPETIRPDNPDIVRFQPIGLAQSPCFQRTQMTCLTCHDPHRTLESQDSRGIWQCTQCHDGTHAEKPLCGAHHTDDCLRCHMPRVRMDRPVSFTDHWIRIREGDPPP